MDGKEIVVKFISIPPRYGTNEQEERALVHLKEFQFLQGTVQTRTDLFEEFIHCEFQFLQGTVQTIMFTFII